MIRLFFTATIFLVLLVPVAASAKTRQASESFTITQQVSDLGYNDDVVLNGTRAIVDLAFPLPETGISNGTLLLHFHLSQLLDERSTVQILVNDQPRLSTTAGELAHSGDITLPLSALQTPFLQVRIIGNLTDGEERCIEKNTDSLWMIVGKDSQFTYTASLDQPSIRDFVHLPGGEVMMRGAWDTPEQQSASIALYSALSYLYRNTPTHLSLEGATGAQPSNGFHREIVLDTNPNAQVLRLDGSRLMVAANRNALNTLLAYGGQPLLFGNNLNALKTASAPVNAQAASKSTSQRTLAQLGLNDQERSGTGVLPIVIRFTLADLGGWPRDLRFTLDTTFDSISTDTNDRASLRVRLNGTLIETKDIRNLSTLQNTIALPADLIQAENYLEIAFVYARETGDCRDVPFSFTGQLRNTSGFVWNGYGEGRGNVPELISTFSGDGDLYLLDATPEMARATAQLVGGLSHFTAMPLLPTMREASALGQATKVPYRIVVGGDSSTAQMLKLPVDINSDVTITDPETKATIVQGQPGQPLAAAQYLPGNVPTLAIQHSRGADATLLAHTIAQIVDPERFFKLKGDVVIGNSDRVLALDLGSNGLEEVTPASAGWQGNLTNYRWMLIVLAAALIGGLWWQIYTRVGRRPPLPTLPEDAKRAEQNDDH